MILLKKKKDSDKQINLKSEKETEVLENNNNPEYLSSFVEHQILTIREMQSGYSFKYSWALHYCQVQLVEFPNHLSHQDSFNSIILQ